MKKILAAILTALVSLSAAACSDDDGRADHDKELKPGSACDFKTFSEYCRGDKAVYCDYPDDNETVPVVIEMKCDAPSNCIALKDYYGIGINSADCYMADQKCGNPEEKQTLCIDYDEYSVAGTVQCYQDADNSSDYYMEWDSNSQVCENDKNESTYCAADGITCGTSTEPLQI